MYAKNMIKKKWNVVPFSVYNISTLEILGLRVNNLAGCHQREKYCRDSCFDLCFHVLAQCSWHWCQCKPCNSGALVLRLPLLSFRICLPSLSKLRTLVQLHLIIPPCLCVSLIFIQTVPGHLFMLSGTLIHE